MPQFLQNLVLASALASTVISPASAVLYKAPVQIKDGKVQGFQALNSTTASNLTNWQDITAWLGIPFAADTSKYRWKAPQPAVPWKTTLNATAYGDGCPQSTSLAFRKNKRQVDTDPVATGTFSENCLSVNIWSPATSANANLPVAVWSYGAGSTSSDSQFDGSGMASKGMVFVTYNYRSGPFGWLTLPELAAESAHNVSGNYGLLDQIYVLEWVKENIAAFGGNPNHVTTVGQSFGSGAVLHTINSPLAKGLVVGAIAESGIKDPFDPELSGFGSDYTTYDVLIPFSETYAKSLNATTVAELRNLTTDELLDGTGVSAFSGGFDPVLDGWAIPWTYFESLKKGPVNDVPILVGNNRDEDGVTFDANYTVAEYEAFAEERYNATIAKKFLELYPANTTAEATVAYKAQIRDEARVSTWLYSASWAKTAKSAIYQYEFDHAPPGQTGGAFHAAEIPYALNTLYADTTTAWEADDYKIAAIISEYWANFIKTGNPNGNGLVKWPANSPKLEKNFNIGNSFQDVPLASPAQVNEIINWFHNATTTPY